MESNVDITKICYGCLCCVAENKLFKLNIENGPLQCVFQVNFMNSLFVFCFRSISLIFISIYYTECLFICFDLFLYFVNTFKH